jgi:hypothetical protein
MNVADSIQFSLGDCFLTDNDDPLAPPRDFIAATREEEQPSEAARRRGVKPEFSEYDISNFYHGSGDDPLNLVQPYAEWWYRNGRPNGYYLYEEAVGSAPTTHVRVKDGKTGRWKDLLNLASYNYLGLSYRPEVKAAAAEAIEKYGLGASGHPSPRGPSTSTRSLPRSWRASRTKRPA